MHAILRKPATHKYTSHMHYTLYISRSSNYVSGGVVYVHNAKVPCFASTTVILATIPYHSQDYTTTNKAIPLLYH